MRSGPVAPRRDAKRWLGLAVALGALGACAGAMPEPAAGDPVADPLAKAAADAGPRDAAADGDCPHGKLEDPHRGFVRCLEPHEADAGWLPPPPQPEPGVDPDAGPAADAGAGAAPDAGAATDAGAAPDTDAGAAPDTAAGPPVPGPAPVVEIKPATFVNGDVPNVEKKLQKLSEGIAKCVADAGGLNAASGTVKLQFLVRARGKAEGVEILSAKGVSAAAQECVRLLLKNRSVGTPSSDPVGVNVTISLKAPK